MAEAQTNPPTGAATASRRTPSREEAGSSSSNGEHRAFAERDSGHGSDRSATHAAAHAAAEARHELAERSRRASREAAASWRDAMEPLFGLPMEMNRWLSELWSQTGADSFSGLRPARPFAAWSMAPLLGMPPADVKETREAYQLCIELAGLVREDIELRTEGDTLVVCGQKSEERSDSVSAYRVSERRFGRFERRFPIPVEVERDHIKAAFHNGVLTITLPKTAAAASDHKRIEISG